MFTISIAIADCGLSWGALTSHCKIIFAYKIFGSSKFWDDLIDTNFLAITYEKLLALSIT